MADDGRIGIDLENGAVFRAISRMKITLRTVGFYFGWEEKRVCSTVSRGWRSLAMRPVQRVWGGADVAAVLSAEIGRIGPMGGMCGEFDAVSAG